MRQNCPGDRRVRFHRLASRDGARRGGLRRPGDDAASRRRYDGAGTPVAGRCGRSGQPGRRAAPVSTSPTTSCTRSATADFEAKDAAGGPEFRDARVADAGVERIVYLGGLGADDGDLSPHLRSRRKVEQLLGAGKVPVTVLRAAVVVGARQHLLGDHPPADRPPAGAAHPAVGQHPYATDRAARRGPLPRRRPRTGRGARARSTRSAGLTCSATSTCSSAPPRVQGKTAAEPHRAVADPPALLGLAGPGHRRRPGHRAQPGRLDDDRGDRARPLDRDARARETIGYEESVRLALADRARSRASGGSPRTRR